MKPTASRGACQFTVYHFHFLVWLSFFFVSTTSLGVVKSSEVLLSAPSSPFPFHNKRTDQNNHYTKAEEIDDMDMSGSLTEEDKKFLERVQSSVKTVLNWESDIALIQACRQVIPWEELNDSRGKYSRLEDDRLLEGDALFLQRLCRWFQSFMSWVNAPPCKVCGCTECDFKTVRGPESEEEKEGEAKRVEVYYCPECDANTTMFPRYNKARKLLETKQGRCGEYSNLFGLFCRSTGLETRLILDLSDHLWTEVWICDSWVMADGCEGIIDKPSMYEYGWGKKELCYMIGICNDHILDVTPRYTRNYMTEDFQTKRRSHTSSENVSDDIFLKLNKKLQSNMSKARLDALQHKLKLEMIELQTFKQATDWTQHEKYGRGRISGSLAWKLSRQEAGGKSKKVNGDDSEFAEERVARFEVESYGPPVVGDKLSFVVKPNPTSRHDAIMVANTPCAIGEKNSLSVVVVDETYLGCILQSRSFLTWESAKEFIDYLPPHRIVLMNGYIKKSEEEEAVNGDNKLVTFDIPRLGGWKEGHVLERGVIYVGQVDAHPDWSFCTTVQDCSNEGHEIVLRIPGLSSSTDKQKRLRTEKRTYPQRVAGRLPESIMPLKTQLLASEEQKRLAFASFCNSNNHRYSGYTTKRSSPIYLLDSSSYPFQKMDFTSIGATDDDIWNTFHFLPPPLVPENDNGITSTSQTSDQPIFDVPLEVEFFKSSLGTHLQTNNNALLPTADALRNSRLIALYFSAHWCGPCRSFTPMLAEMYEHLKEARTAHGLEIVFVSSDRDQSSFQQYFSTMPWQAIPFDNLQFVKQSLSMTYGVRGIPSLVILDALSGRIVVPPNQSRQEVSMACRGGDQAIVNMLDSWLERAPQESLEMLSMLQLSCQDTIESPKDDDNNNKENEYLILKEKGANFQLIDTAARIKELFQKLVAEGNDPTTAAAKAISIVGEGQKKSTKLNSGPLNGKAIQIGPHKDNNILDHTFTTLVDHNSPSEVADVLSTMLKYLNNAAKEPWTPKYRTFKLSNKVADQITRVEGGLELLQGIGFDVFGTSQDFKATLPAAADLNAMTERLKGLLESLPTMKL